MIRCFLIQLLLQELRRQKYILIFNLRYGLLLLILLDEADSRPHNLILIVVCLIIGVLLLLVFALVVSEKLVEDLVIYCLSGSFSRFVLLDCKALTSGSLEYEFFLLFLG